MWTTNFYCNHRIKKCLIGSSYSLYFGYKYGASVTSIFDGFDEVSGKLCTELFQKKMLPKARVVVTSQPSASTALQVLKRRIIVEGLDQTSRKEYMLMKPCKFFLQSWKDCKLKCFQTYN